MGNVTFGSAWQRAWEQVPLCIRESTLMTSPGGTQPLKALINTGLMKAILGEDMPLHLRKQVGKNAHSSNIVSELDASTLSALVSNHIPDLRTCHELFKQVDAITRRLRLSPPNSGRAEQNARIVRTLFVEQISDPAAIEQQIVRHYEPYVRQGTGTRVTAPDLSEEQQVRARLLASWTIPPSRSEDALKRPDGLVYFHNRVPENTWRAAVDWTSQKELRGWEKELYLTRRESLTPPAPTGPTLELPPLDRSLSGWLSGRTRDSAKAERPIPRSELIDQEIVCAVSPLGLPSNEARAIILLGYWLVAWQRFDRPARPPSDSSGLEAGPGVLPSREEIDKILSDLSSATENEISAAQYSLMMRPLWAKIGGLSRGKIRKPAQTRTVIDDRHKGRTTRPASAKDQDSAELLSVNWAPVTWGEQLLAHPGPSFMCRLWARVHTYSHRGPMTAGVASYVLKATWDSWVNDVTSRISLPDRSPDWLTEADLEQEILTLELLEQVLSESAPSTTAPLVLEILKADDPLPLQRNWQVLLKRAPIDQKYAHRLKLDDIYTVQAFLRQHLSEGTECEQH